MKTTYFLPPVDTNKIWSRFEEGNGTYLSIGGKEILLYKDEIDVIKGAQNVLYRSLYPKYDSHASTEPNS